MYFLLVLLTAVCVVVLVATILFVVGAAAILADEGMRIVIVLPTKKSVRPFASFSMAISRVWKMTVSDQLGSLSTNASKL
ncbi:exported hypothetical protein [Acidobacteriia bacterium SbA2]|nr:exported hypothetical protein [Acidobacteriia bacterium SbA2]